MSFVIKSIALAISHAFFIWASENSLLYLFVNNCDYLMFFAIVVLNKTGS